jgi:NADH-quinone oxidoreductase subunit J
MPGTLVFIAIAGLILGSGMGMLLVRNTIYSALLLVFNFLNVALLYLFLGAPFIALTQITVYAGAIMVLFLFVIMLLGTEVLSRKEVLKGQRAFAGGLAVVFILEMVLVFNQHEGLLGNDVLAARFVSPAEIGEALFTTYALPVEMTAFILLSAAIGAVLFTHKEKQKRQLTEEKKASDAQDNHPDLHKENL